jgi:hypothetical protein
MRDISDKFAAKQIVCCPLCDNAIDSFVPAEIVEAHACKFLVCSDCLEELTALKEREQG